MKHKLDNIGFNEQIPDTPTVQEEAQHLTPSLGNKILVSESPMGNYFKA